jgi:teichuronic acid biosynthesis glycosyltransferase TuaC
VIEANLNGISRSRVPAVLVVVPNYPYAGYSFSGVFNQRSVRALTKLCGRVEVLAPRPYVPPLISALTAQWKAYATIPSHEIQDGVVVCRPATPVLPRIAQAFWCDQGRFLWARRTARTMHRCTRFDAIMSFDLVGAGGIAWRLARDLRIPASGWATGGDVRVNPSSPHGRVVIRALRNLDLVFYQSYELLEKAAGFLGTSAEKLLGPRHVVLPRGIVPPPQVCKTQARNRVRAKWGVKADEIVALYLGRISCQKGLLELLEAFALAASVESRLRAVLLGSRPAFDDTAHINNKLSTIPWVKDRVMLLPECAPDDVWENFCAADLFTFPSHNEGMPNSLLEAMAMGLPAIAFGIPAIRELEMATGAPVVVPPFDCGRFAEAILRLASSSDERARIGNVGKELVLDRFMVFKNMAEALRLVLPEFGDSSRNLESHGSYASSCEANEERQLRK